MFKGIEHVEIVSGNLDRTLNFYTEILGFKIRSRRKSDRHPMAEIAYLELGGTLIEVFGVKDPAPVSTEEWQTGYRRIALEVGAWPLNPSIGVEEVVTYLKEKGVQVSQEPVVTDTFTMAEILDPDGIRIQLIKRK